MPTPFRRLLGLLLAVQCTVMLVADIWLLYSIDFGACGAMDKVVLIGWPMAELIGLAGGLLLLVGKPRNAKGEKRLGTSRSA